MAMISPYTTGGGGTHFEARVTAYYLAATLTDAPARGVPGLRTVEVLTQRAAFGDPLDDVIVVGQLADGTRARLHLQVKSDLTFTENDEEWVSVLQQAWQTFKGSFNDSRDRLGVAIATYSARADKHYRAVLNWAVHSPDSANFVERVTKEAFSHQDKRTFVTSVRTVLASYAGHIIDDDTLWRFLRCFEIVHFDFSAETGSRDVEGAEDRLRGHLPVEQKDQASSVWAYLVAKAGEIIPVGGGATRTTLVRHLEADNLPVGTSSRFLKDIEAINQESKRALSTIKADLHGLRLHRSEAYDKVQAALSAGRFIQIDGEPGTGKSALLKEIAEETAQLGTIFVLKDSRIQPRGWSAQAAFLGISSDLTSLLVELGTVAEPILFIDGIDKISDQATQLTVNDLIIAIATEPALARWKVLATVREQNLQHIATWLSPDALKQLPVRTVTVSPFGSDDLRSVTTKFPRLRPLMLEAGTVDVILKRPFFLEAVLSLAGRDGTTSLPATEVELLKLWWELGAADRSDFTPAQTRRSALLELASRLAAAPDTPISIRGIQPEPIGDLKSAGIIRDVRLGHTVAFTHDIYEEWALCQLLIGELGPISALLMRLKEPQALVRPIQLLGSFALESHPTEQEWLAIYEDVSDPALRPVWQRAVLTSCLRSTRTTEILAKLANYLHQDDDDRLKKLLIALRTLEVIPNPIFLDERTFPDLDPEERVQYANHAALPKIMTWVRFLDWYLPHAGNPSPTLIPELVPVFSTWQSSCGGQNIRHCRRIGTIAHAWLMEFEEARHPDKFADRRDPFGVDFPHDVEENLEKDIRSLVLSSAGDIPQLVQGYLSDKADHKLSHIFRDEIIRNCAGLARSIPTALVDYILKAFLEHPQRKKDRWGSHSDMLADDLGISDHHAFYPASPLQPPFLVLLRNNEAEGLRLIRALCNHSIEVWRWAEQRRSRANGQPLTPLPVEVEFPWGRQSFWGDDQVYLWFRGIWGNSAVGSALMALEQWALERVEAGDDFATTFRKILEGNEAVAALGLATSLALAHPDKSIECTLPLVTCSHIWVWDLRRAVQDQGGPCPNEIGNWHRDRYYLTAVRQLNRKPHRSRCIRDLVPHFVFWHDPAIRERYVEGIRSFTARLPYQYEEAKQNYAHTRALREEMNWFVEQADPQYWHAEPTDDGKIKIWNAPPSANDPERVRQLEEHALLNRCMALALWAHESIKDCALETRFTLETALVEAKRLDEDTLFDCPVDHSELLGLYRKSAVAGAACVLARFANSDMWNEETSAWCFDVLSRTSAMPPDADSITYRGSALSMHPLIFAVHGFSALLAKGYRSRDCQSALLNFAVDPLEQVVQTVATASDQYASDHADFYWILFQLLVRHCIFVTDAAPNYHSLIWDEAEAKRNLALVEEAEAAIDKGTRPNLPEIPMPWVVRPDAPPSDDNARARYASNDLSFHWTIAEKTILVADFKSILLNNYRRRQLMRLIRQLVDFSIQKAMPPFARTRRHRQSNAPYEWIYSLFGWTGSIAASLTPAEVREAILGPIFAADTETGLLAMQCFMRSFMIYALLLPAEVSQDSIEIWNASTDWIFEHAEGRYGGSYIDRHIVSCVTSTLFCVQGDFQPLICGLKEGSPTLRTFLPTIEKTVRRFGMNVTLYLVVLRFMKEGGFDLLPEPSLDWLAEIVVDRKQDRAFWDANGHETVELLKALLEKKTSELTPAHRTMISLISDILVDNGVRGAGFLQQEQLRER
ncbi:NACHT domain-containing protein [Candidatus Filomicrobium marinum]|nr:ATP-binding protein [Candidatus Filomicrobium marinum]